MDFGLDRLIEMLEARFGKRVTDFVVGILGVALVVLAISAIWSHGVAPIADAVQKLPKGNVDWESVAANAGVVFLVAGGTILLLNLAARVYWERRMRIGLKKNERLLSDVGRLLDETKTIGNEMMTVRDETAQMQEFVRMRLDIIEARLKKSTPDTAAPQPPPTS